MAGLRSVYDFVSRYVRDSHIRTVLSFHPLFIGGNPFRASASYSIVPYLEKQGGVHFAMGGMYSVIQAMVQLLRELGGESHCDTPVSGLISSDHKIVGVKTRSGSVMMADVVVNSDAATTFLELTSAEDKSPFWSIYWRKASYSMSCFVLYLGLSRQYPELPHHTIIMPRNFKRVVADIFDLKRIPGDIPLYIHTPTRTDASMAPPGGESMYVLVPVPNLRSKVNWDIAESLLRERVLDALESEVGLTGIRESIVVEHRYTPIDFRDDLGSWLGAAFSIEPTLIQSAYFRPHNRLGGVEGLYLVGARTHPGAGVPGVLLSAEITTRMILDEHPSRSRKHEER